jgi:hypothetical protein
MSHSTDRPDVQRLVALLAVAGLLLGVLGALLFTSRPGEYRAHAVLAMLPGPVVELADQPEAWEVLTKGQATRTAAVVLGQSHWLDGAARAAGGRPGDFTLVAGAIPETTLVEVTVDAGSASAAETALRSVLDTATPDAARASGPFALELVQQPAGSATPLAPARLPVYLALAVAGAAVGAGADLLLGARRRTPALRGRLTPDDPHRPAPADPGGAAGSVESASDVEVAAGLPERLDYPLGSREG